ncbi:MAG: sodium-dependent bicarbonate transport family permease [Verrucomicrobiales bacterium]|nr:sodium-dependent bicarbonate transport family permease [Verrucomicrobiales bacterium]
MDLLLQNLVSPIVLAFLLGALARWVKSDLEIPDAIYQGISIYLLFAIGLKGGIAMAETPLDALVLPVGATILLGVITPITAFFLLKSFARLDRINASAAAAHYGSVSAVTFVAAIDAAKSAGLPAEGFMPALVAVLEVPGIIVALLFARQSRGGGIKAALHELVVGKSIFLLLGGLAIGALCGPTKMESVTPFFIDPFKGVLCLFLLELGMVAAKRVRDVREAGWRLIVSGCLLPLFHGLLGTLVGHLVGLSPGGAAVLGAMVGSASYIAAPAAVRMALPKASPGIYLTLSLGITFPFNLGVGIPVFLAISKTLESVLP